MKPVWLAGHPISGPHSLKDPMPVIRRSTPADRPVLKTLVLALHEHVRPYDPRLPEGPTIIDDYFAFLERRVEESQGTFFIAEDGGEILGYLCLFGLCEPDQPDEAQELHSYVADLYVRPGTQGSGVGSRLLEEAEAMARSLGVARIELAVLAENEPAARFYARRGYHDRVTLTAKRFDE